MRTVVVWADGARAIPMGVVVICDNCPVCVDPSGAHVHDLCAACKHGITLLAMLGWIPPEHRGQG